MQVASYYKIADLNLRISGCDKIVGFSEFETAQHSDIDIDIKCGCTDITVFATELNRFVVDNVAYVFSRYDKGYIFRLVEKDNRTTSLRYDQDSNTVMIESCENRQKLQFMLWVAFSLVAINHGVVPIHSSVVVYQGDAILFLGESSAGKSTQSRLWLEHIKATSLLNDDSPILRIVNGDLMVYGSPWSGKTPCYINEHYRAKAFVRVVKFEQSIIEQNDTIHSFAALYPSLPPMFAYDQVLNNKLIRFTSDIIPLAATYTLRCTKEQDAVQTTFSELYGKNNHPE